MPTADAYPGNRCQHGYVLVALVLLSPITINAFFDQVDVLQILQKDSNAPAQTGIYRDQVFLQ